MKFRLPRKVMILAMTGLMVSLVSLESNGQNRDRGKGRNRGRSDANALKVGQEAPAFKLKSMDGKSETELAAFRGKKPVVLIFGSYS